MPVSLVADPAGQRGKALSLSELPSVLSGPRPKSRNERHADGEVLDLIGRTRAAGEVPTHALRFVGAPVGTVRTGHTAMLKVR